MIELYNKPVAWASGDDEFSSVVVSTRIRLARNLSTYPFVTAALPKQLEEVDALLSEKLTGIKWTTPAVLYKLNDLETLDRQVLFERHFISSEHLKSKHQRSVLITNNESVSIMVNEEDHLRIQTLEPSFNPQSAYQITNGIDDLISDIVPYAFSNKFGYVTTCPTNIGTGLRVSIMMHLPAIVYTKQIEKVIQSLTRISYTIRGFYGEGTSPLGNFFQISNQVTLGRSEEEIIEELTKVVPEIVKFELNWRTKLHQDEGAKIEDKIWRSYGVLKHARSITSEESLELLSAIRLGINMKIINDIPLNSINDLLTMVQPAHLQRIHGQPLKETVRDTIRATFIREKLGAQK